MADLFLRNGIEYAPGKMITITKVRMSPDLSFAKIFISIFPSEKRDEVLAGSLLKRSRRATGLGNLEGE